MSLRLSAVPKDNEQVGALFSVYFTPPILQFSWTPQSEY